MIDISVLCLSSDTLLNFRFDAGRFLEVIIAPLVVSLLLGDDLNTGGWRESEPPIFIKKSANKSALPPRTKAGWMTLSLPSLLLELLQQALLMLAWVGESLGAYVMLMG